MRVVGHVCNPRNGCKAKCRPFQCLRAAHRYMSGCINVPARAQSCLLPLVPYTTVCMLFSDLQALCVFFNCTVALHESIDQKVFFPVQPKDLRVVCNHPSILSAHANECSYLHPTNRQTQGDPHRRQSGFHSYRRFSRRCIVTQSTKAFLSPMNCQEFRLSYGLSMIPRLQTSHNSCS